VAVCVRRESDHAPPKLCGTWVDSSVAEIGNFYRPKKKPLTVGLNSDVIAWLKAVGRVYQTKANWLLKNAKLHSTREASISRAVKRPAAR